MSIPDLTFHHLGVAVPNLDKARASLQALFGYQTLSGPFFDPLQDVTVEFIGRPGTDPRTGPITSPSTSPSIFPGQETPVIQAEINLGLQPVIELVTPGSADSPVSNFLKKGLGGYHLCYETADLEPALTEARKNGCLILGKAQPAVAFGGRHIAWLYTPASCLIELLQK